MTNRPTGVGDMFRKLAIGLTIFSLVASSCGSSGDDATGTTAAPATTAAAPATTAAAPAAPATTAAAPATTVEVDAVPEEMVLGESISFTHAYGFLNTDPDLSPGGPDLPILALVYDGLVTVGPNFEAMPGMAESWEYSDDGLSVDFNLRAGITFTDGEVFDANVAKANLDRSMTLEKSRIKGILGNVDSVEVVDTMTLRLNLKSVDTTVPLILAARAGYMVSPAQVDLEAITEPVGSGMFILTEFTSFTSGSFVRNPDYWNAEIVKVKGLEMTVAGDSTTRLNAVISGASNLARIDSRQIEDAEAAGLDVVKGTDSRFYTIQLNPSVEPALGDPNVRLAISLAIDREGIVAGILFGNGEALDQTFPAGTVAFNEEIVGAFDQDIDRAKQLLADAGYGDGFGFTIMTGTGADATAITEAIQAQLGEIGIDIAIEQGEGFAPGQAYWTDQRIAGAMFRSSAAYSAVSTLQKLYIADVMQNPGNVTSPTVDALIAEALAETDIGAQSDIVRQISAELVEAPLSVIPLVMERQVQASSNDLGGLLSWLSGYPYFQNVTRG